VRKQIEEALASWRDAVRRQDNATDGDRDALDAEVARYRDMFNRLSSEYMIDRIDALRDAEDRRQGSTPSTQPFHDAAREEKAIAAEIWDTERVSDEETPGATKRDEDRDAA
jgi:hypothetical protein